jgi:REP element-mobilizing transposase RayT
VTFSERPLFFLTICTHKRRRILANNEAHEAFTSFCLASLEKAEVWVGRYVLMPDHLHVFACAKESHNISRWVASLKKFMAKHWRHSGLVAPFWQKGFFDHVLRTGESYSQEWGYIRENPVSAGLVRSVDDWPYQGEIHNLWW